MYKTETNRHHRQTKTQTARLMAKSCGQDGGTGERRAQARRKPNGPTPRGGKLKGAQKGAQKTAAHTTPQNGSETSRGKQTPNLMEAGQITAAAKDNARRTAGGGEAASTCFKLPAVEAKSDSKGSIAQCQPWSFCSLSQKFAEFPLVIGKAYVAYAAACGTYTPTPGLHHTGNQQIAGQTLG